MKILLFPSPALGEGLGFLKTDSSKGLYEIREGVDGVKHPDVSETSFGSNSRTVDVDVLLEG